jgi:hypothetical protein
MKYKYFYNILFAILILSSFYYFLNIENFAIKKKKKKNKKNNINNITEISKPIISTDNNITEVDKPIISTDNNITEVSKPVISTDNYNTYCRNLSTFYPGDIKNFDDLQNYPEKYSIGCLNDEYLKNLLLKYNNESSINKITDKDGNINTVESSSKYPYYSYQCCSNNKTKPLLSTDWKCINIDRRFVIFRRNNDGDVECPSNTSDPSSNNICENLITQTDCENKIKSIDNNTKLIKCNSNDLVNNYNKPLNICTIGYNKLL